MTSSRAAQEVQAAMVIAKRFPRDQELAYANIMVACKRRALAEEAIYSYPRGGTQVEGPSIRLAEALAQNWGNIDFGIIELEQRPGESTVMAYAWDLQTNTRQTKIFTVQHARKSGERIVALTDPRDVYEMVANQGARRVRNCILGVIPGDVVDAALDACNQTLKKQSDEPLIDRIRKMAAAFGELGVTVAMVEERLGHKLDASSENELVKLRKIYKSIKDGVASREDWFKVAPAETAKPRISSDEKAEAEAGLAPQTPKAKAETKEAEPSKEPSAGKQVAAPVEEVFDSEKDLQLLAKLLAEIKCDEDKFLRWLKESKYLTTPLSHVGELALCSPKKLHNLVANFAKYKDSIIAAK